MTYTVYFIENEVNHKGYVGVTRNDVDERFAQHIRVAERGEGGVLHQAIRKHGAGSFEIVPLTWASREEEAFRLERKWVERLQTYGDQYGYNMTEGGENTPLQVGEEASVAEVSDEKAYEVLERLLLTDEREYSQADAAEELGVSTSLPGKWRSGDTRPHLLDRFHKNHPDYDGWTAFDDRLLAALTEFMTTDASLNKAAEKHGVKRGQIWGCRTGESRTQVLEKFHRQNPDWDGVPNGHCGENHHAAELTEAEVQQIRREYAYTSQTQYDLADKHDVSQLHVSRIVNREVWDTLPEIEGPQRQLLQQEV